MFYFLLFAKYLGCRVDRKNLLVEHGGRSVRIRPLPIGIPFDHFVELAKSAKRIFKTKQKIILGVDRLDYTKGLVNRLKAFEVLLERHPEHRELVTLLQVSVPSRTDVSECKIFIFVFTYSSRDFLIQLTFHFPRSTIERRNGSIGGSD